MTGAISLSGVDRAYGDFRALKNVNMNVARGSVHALLGPNGSGKSTAIRIALGLLDADAGSVRLLGEVPSPSVRKRRVGYLPEQRSLYLDMTIREHLMFVARMRGLGRQEAQTRVLAWLERIELADRAKTRGKALSKGLQQKVAIASALLHEPELVIFDEPFNGLDPVAQSWLEAVVRELSERGATVVLSTHLIEHAERLASHATLIVRSHTVAEDSVMALRLTARRGWFELCFDGDPAFVEGPEVLETRPLPGGLGIRLDGDGQDLLRRALGAGVVLTRFEEMLPTLRDIVVEATNAG